MTPGETHQEDDSPEPIGAILDRAKMRQSIERLSAKMEAAEADRRAAPAIRAGWAVQAHAMGMPRVLCEASFERSKDTEALRVARQYAVTTPLTGALVLLGDTGVGKSWAAACALRHAWEHRGLDAGCFYWPGFCTTLRVWESRERAWALARNVQILMLDDVGPWSGGPPGFAQSVMDELIYYREGDRLPTLITANLTTDKLAEITGGRGWDRLASWASLHKLVGESLR